MSSMFEQRRKDEQALEDKHYREATTAEGKGYEDGYAGKPDRTTEMGSLGYYYGGGYEQGVADRTTEAEEETTDV